VGHQGADEDTVRDTLSRTVATVAWGGLLVCLCGVLPGLVFLFLVYGSQYTVTVRMANGDRVLVYKGRSETRMREIADTLCEVVGISYT
jgi:hypothetical protein